KFGAQFLVKLNCLQIPIEHLPAYREAILFLRKPREIDNNRLADSMTAKSFSNINVFQKDRPPFKTGVVIEVQGIPGGLSLPFQHQSVEPRVCSEPVAQQHFFSN